MSIVYYEGCAACDQRKWLNDPNTDLEAANPSIIRHTCLIGVTPPKPIDTIGQEKSRLLGSAQLNSEPASEAEKDGGSSRGPKDSHNITEAAAAEAIPPSNWHLCRHDILAKDCKECTKPEAAPALEQGGSKGTLYFYCSDAEAGVKAMCTIQCKGCADRQHECPVCYYDKLAGPPKGYNICPRCGTEFGNDDEDKTHEQLRKEWIIGGCEFFFTSQPKPESPQAEGAKEEFRSNEELLRQILFYCRTQEDAHPKFKAAIREACIKLQGFDPEESQPSSLAGSEPLEYKAVSMAVRAFNADAASKGYMYVVDRYVVEAMLRAYEGAKQSQPVIEPQLEQLGTCLHYAYPHTQTNECEDWTRYQFYEQQYVSAHPGASEYKKPEIDPLVSDVMINYMLNVFDVCSGADDARMVSKCLRELQQFRKAQKEARG